MLVIGLSKISKAFLGNLPKGILQNVVVVSPRSKLDGVKCVRDYNEITPQKYIFLGCKPQNLNDVASQIDKNIINKETVVISVLAGTKIRKIQKAFGVQKVVRIMPSIAFEFGGSIVGMSFQNCMEDEVNHIIEMLKPNRVVIFQNEADINGFTAVYASGMGFVFEIMGGFSQNVKKVLPQMESYDLTLNMFKNAINFLEKKCVSSYSEAVQMVASKGGTTEAGLNVMRNNDVMNELIKTTMENCIKKAEDLEK